MSDIERLFIANRGEICRRIAITAKRMGMGTVTFCDQSTPALYLSPYVDTFIQAPAAGTYLNQDVIINAAKDSGCDALHPGFGFLSENFQFAEAVMNAGLTWVGPPPASMRDMASKSTARDIAVAADVPTNAGIKLSESDDVATTAAAIKSAKIPYPLLIKAALGGGGKGMRVVEREEDLEEAMQRASSEALNAFGDSTLLAERYLPNPRHIEVQILADQHGCTLAVGDRDCSVQRRHQKIIEEAPAPDLTGKTRAALHAAAIKLADAVNYTNAGTVEFLLDAAAAPSTGDLQPFFFLEMNTRLQVEHPVSEEVCGIDLVEWQLHIAAGKPLTIAQSELTPRGHAVEVRLYAENCENNFLPCPGPVHYFAPAVSPGIRWETGLAQMEDVSAAYDPMLAKCIALAPTRTSAIDRLRSALQGTALCGTKNNKTYLEEILRDQDFRQQAPTTSYIKQKHTQLLASIDARQSKLKGMADSLLEKLRQDTLIAAGASGRSTAEVTQACFSGSRTPPPSGGEILENFTCNASRLAGHRVQGQRLWCTDKTCPDGQGIEALLLKSVHKSGSELFVVLEGLCFSDRIVRPSMDQYGADASEEIIAPVPGKVVSVQVSENQGLEKNTVILVLESMKMEFEIKAARDGKLSRIHVKAGEQVTAGQKLANWELD